MYRFCLYLSVALVVILSAALANAEGVCTGYPKMYNGKPCASTTRYYDGNMGACGCGGDSTNPFSWQYTKPTAAASAPIFGAGTWCGSGCGKCFKLTPTAIGASAEGTGAPSLESLVVKVTNLCPYSGNEAWCAYDTNTFGYDAHFDLMDYNMNGVISNMGWNNPEVTYEEVDCAANGYTDWNCQCASASSGTATPAATEAPTATSAATKAPTAASAATKAPTAAPAATQAPATKAPATEAPATEAPASEAPVQTTAPATTVKPSIAATSAPASESPSTGASIKVQVNGGSNAWWFGVSLVTPSVSDLSYVEVKDSSSNSVWTKLTYQGSEYWNLYSVNPSTQMKAPLSLRFTGVNGNVVTADNIITAFQSATVDTGAAL